MAKKLGLLTLSAILVIGLWYLIQGRGPADLDSFDTTYSDTQEERRSDRRDRDSRRTGPGPSAPVDIAKAPQDGRQRPSAAPERPADNHYGIEDDEIYFPRFDQMTEEELDQLEEFYDETEERWTRRMREFILQDLGLSQNVFEDYENLRDEFEDARWAEFEKFHERLFEEEGDDFQFRMADYFRQVELPLAETFRERLRGVIGEDNFRQFLDVRDDFNRDLRSRQDPRMGTFIVHF